MVLRPVAILVAAFGVLTIERGQIRPVLPVFVVFLLAVILTAVHLIPLPPGIWQALPGRQIIIEIDKLAGLKGIWRPLSMSPDATLNALYALAIPAAVLLIGTQLQLDDHYRLMRVLLCMALGSCLVVVAQSAGSDIAFFPWTSENAGVFANRNHQAALFTTMFPMLAASAYFAERQGIDGRLTKFASTFIGIGLIPLVIVTGSRTGLALAILAIFFLPALHLAHQGRPDRSRLQRLAAPSAAIAGILILASLTIFNARDLAISRLDNSLEDARYPVWESVVKDTTQYLPWGSGIGTFSEVYQINEPSNLLRPQYFNHAHNDWLEVFYTAGIPGGVLMCGAVALALVGAWQARNGRGRTFALSRTGLLMLFLLALASVTDYPTRTPLLAAVAVIAAIWSTAYRRQDDEA